MDTVTAYQAKTHLSALLERARCGESITITKHGHPVAKLVPLVERPDSSTVIEQIRALSDTLSIGVPARELIEEGRRY